MKLALLSLAEPLSMNPPIGLASLATYLKRRAGLEGTVVVDGVFDAVHERLEKLKPDLIGISAMTVHYGAAIRAARAIRTYSRAQIVIGGVHISTLPQSLHEAFDFAVVGEGEETLREVAARFAERGPLAAGDLSEIAGVAYRGKDGRVRLATPRPLAGDLDEIPFPDLGFLDERYFRPREEVGLRMVARCAPMLTARGCPYRCVFCSTASFWGRFRQHSVEAVVEHVRHLVEEMGVGVINILDDMFTLGKKRLEETRALMESKGLLGKVVFTCNARSNHIDDEMCSLLRSLGVGNLNFGFESGSDRMLDYLKVGSVTVEKNRRAVTTCKRHGLVVYGSLMFGCPGETIEEMRQTLGFIDFARREGADYLWSFVATPFPQTPFWEEAKKRGRISDDMDWEHETLFSHQNSDRPLLADVEPGAFRAVFGEGRRKLRRMRYRLIARFVLSRPLAAAKLFAGNSGYYLKRFYYYVFRF